MKLVTLESVLIIGGIVLLIAALETRRQIRDRDVLDDESIRSRRGTLWLLSLFQRGFDSYRILRSKRS